MEKETRWQQRSLGTLDRMLDSGEGASPKAVKRPAQVGGGRPGAGGGEGLPLCLGFEWSLFLEQGCCGLCPGLATFCMISDK